MYYVMTEVNPYIIDLSLLRTASQLDRAYEQINCWSGGDRRGCNIKQTIKAIRLELSHDTTGYNMSRGAIK